MGKRLILVLALALLVTATFSAAYAEVQNVKISGDIIASGVSRQHFNLQSGNPGDKKNIDQKFFMSQIRVRIDADLTDNVQATVRLINERVWNGQYDTNTATSNNGNSSIDLDLAYVTLKEFLYSPLTLTVGRQEIRFGNGLVIGNAGVGDDIVNIPTDLSERKSFDAIRATLNYDPLVVDLIYAKIAEDSTIRNNDANLYGINATYALNKKTNVSGYYFLKRDNWGGSLEASAGKADLVNTIGMLISSTPIENLILSLEGAYQFGKADGSGLAPALNYNKHRAYAIQAMADYTFAKVKMTPSIGASYTYLSGEKSGSQSSQNSWDPMYYDQKLGNIAYALLDFRDLSVLNLRASCKPVEDVTVSVLYGYFDMAKAKQGNWMYSSPSRYDGSTHYYEMTGAPFMRENKKHLGDEIDATITYDYTEDVQFGLTGGIFLPGKAWNVEKQNATQLIGSMKVTF
ncbi:MAG: alginate export family protein [Candidatus Omnitrophica bacterium]|nr:alginate export family protein [Candidatus Omnitrophota bacterium]